MPRGQSIRHDARTRVEDMVGLDTRVMREQLVPGCRFHVRWHLTDSVLAEVGLTVGDGYVDVVAAEGLSKSASVTMDLVHRPCHYGGHQTLLVCPQCDCGRMAVYWDQMDTWGCRVCLGLAHASSQMSKSRRKFAKMHRLADRVGIDLATGDLVKVKGQHFGTRQRLLGEYVAALQDALGVG